jgi:hypothetical protein
VTTLDDTLAYLACHPDDQTAFGAAVDRLQEEAGLGRYAAIRRAIHVTRTQEYADDLGWLQQHAGTTPACCLQILEAIAYRAGVAPGTQVWLQLARGIDPPVMSMVRLYGPLDTNAKILRVRVGATWVRRHQRELQREYEPDVAAVVLGWIAQDECDELNITMTSL